MSYSKKTVFLPLVIYAERIIILTWNIDAVFAVYPDCKSNTRACRTLRYGSVLILLSKQKIDTKNSAEAELVRVDDTMIFAM